MNTKTNISCLAILTGASLISCSSEAQKTTNVVYILVDDLGYGDLGCYGQKIVQTPNLDNMAKEGMKFTQHYAGNTVSAPSRCALMTGVHSGHAQIRGNKEIDPEGQAPLNADTYTLGKMFKEGGYSTGIFGKWGLGYPGSVSEPNKAGFDEFYGYNCQRKAHTFYPEYLWHNQEKIYIPENANLKRQVFSQDLIHNQALEFIRENKNKPFFAMLTYTLPHAELAHPKDEIYAMYDAKFNETPSDAYKKWEGKGYCPPEKRHTAFASMVTRLDMYVGEVLAELEELGIDDNTIVIFTSDNGPHIEGGADPKFFNSSGPLKGIKRDLYEGGIRVPMIAWSPNIIKSGTESNHISAFWDVMPTFAQMLNIEIPSETDGISFLPTLTGKGEQKEHDYLYWEYHEAGKMRKQGIRRGDWKFIYNIITREGTPMIEVFNLKEDLKESNNLAEQHPEMVVEFKKLLDESRFDSDIFKATP